MTTAPHNANPAYAATLALRDYTRAPGRRNELVVAVLTWAMEAERAERAARPSWLGPRLSAAEERAAVEDTRGT